jgi:hypothetical protein
MGQNSAAGPHTETVATASYQKIYYVDNATGSETGDGSKTSPWKSISSAVKNIEIKQGQKLPY